MNLNLAKTAASNDWEPWASCLPHMSALFIQEMVTGQKLTPLITFNCKRRRY